MATINFTLDDFRRVIREEATTIVRAEMVIERGYTRQLLAEQKTELMDELTKIRRMLEEYAQAESQRLTRAERRLAKTGRLLAGHIDNRAIHLPGSQSLFTR